jgi:polyribonucleotide nucleotidyltransferase
MAQPHSMNITLIECIVVLKILVETGHIGRQASASVMVTDGETVSCQNLVFAASKYLS